MADSYLVEFTNINCVSVTNLSERCDRLFTTLSYHQFGSSSIPLVATRLPALVTQTNDHTTFKKTSRHSNRWRRWQRFSSATTHKPGQVAATIHQRSSTSDRLTRGWVMWQIRNSPNLRISTMLQSPIKVYVLVLWLNNTGFYHKFGPSLLTSVATRFPSISYSRVSHPWFGC